MISLTNGKVVIFSSPRIYFELLDSPSFCLGQLGHSYKRVKVNAAAAPKASPRVPLALVPYNSQLPPKYNLRREFADKKRQQYSPIDVLVKTQENQD